MIKMTSKTIFFITILVLGGTFIFLSLNKDVNNDELNGNEPGVSETPLANTPTTTPRPQPKDYDGQVLEKIPNQGLVQTPVPRNLITGPATCQLEGSIVFIEKNLYETRGAKIKYQNIDDSSRLIYWKVSPDDGALTVGPNIFAQIRPLPNGEAQVGVTPNKDTTVSKYTLTASVTYGVFDSRGVEEVKTANCSGKVEVMMP